MNSGSKVLLGVLAGAAAGTILGVLFAPDKGEETRRRISEGSRDVTSNLKDKFSEFVDGLADKYDSVKESASDLLDQGRSKANTMAGNVKSEMANVKSEVKSYTGSNAGNPVSGNSAHSS